MRIEITLPDGRTVKADALKKGRFAVHKARLKGYTITHLLTLAAVTWAPSQKDALADRRLLEPLKGEELRAAVEGLRKKYVEKI